MRLLSIVLVILIASRPEAHAQSVAPALFRGDANASLGWFGADRAEPGTCCGGWSASLSKGAGGGYYWTDHLKSELDISWPGTTRGFSYPSGPASTPGSPITYDEHAYTTLKISVSQLYQFGRNATVHPFVGAGVDVDRDRDEITRTTQLGRASSQIHLTEHETHVRPFVTTGIKAYYSERAFFRTDLRVGFSGQVDQVVWRWGLGVDLGKSPAHTRASGARDHEPDQTPLETPELWRTYAAKLPIGSLVTVDSRQSPRFLASLIAVDDTGVLVKPRTRVPEPVRHISFDDLERLDLSERGPSANRAAAIAIAIGAGVGVFLLSTFAFIAAID